MVCTLNNCTNSVDPDQPVTKEAVFSEKYGKYSKISNRNTTFNITETRLFKYIENFTTKKYEKFQIKILIFFIFLLKT